METKSELQRKLKNTYKKYQLELKNIERLNYSLERSRNIKFINKVKLELSKHERAAEKYKNKCLSFSQQLTD